MTPLPGPNWLFSWTEAGRHQRQVLLAMFVQGVIGFGLIAYFRLTPGSLIGSALIGFAGGVVLAFTGFRYSRDPTSVGRRRPLSAYDVLIAAIGLALIVGGVAAQNADLFVAGLPFLVLSLLLVALKTMLTK
jgi:zinc transporter ZupT